MSKDHYDVIIIGTGAGGGTLAHRLAPSGKRILVLERGSFLPREKANWDAVEVFQKERYNISEVWYDKDGKELHPAVGYWVGGNTKFYGGALFRMREQDFGEVIHKGGISPEWPLKYRDFERYYTQAEKIYEVHGQRGLDPTEPKNSGEYYFPPIGHEPRIQEVNEALKEQGLHPFYLPLAIKLNEVNQFLSTCIRCETCDGYPCLVGAKADTEISCVRPAMEQANLTLMTDAKVLRLHTSDSGREVTKVEVEIVKGQRQMFSADIVVVACGATNSAVLLLKSANEKHPNGLANSSNLVGRNFMKHQNGVLVGLSKKVNPTVFQKTMGINDFYWGDKDFNYPMGHIQLLGKVNKSMLEGDVPVMTEGITAEEAAQHSIDWWLMSEDLPDPNNRVRVTGEQIQLEYSDNNTEAFERLTNRWTEILKTIHYGEMMMKCSSYFQNKLPLQGLAHQAGTCRFGEDPTTSVLNLNCRTHDVDNLYVVNGSFFPSMAAVNPSLTIMANALRVGDHLIERMK